MGSWAAGAFCGVLFNPSEYRERTVVKGPSLVSVCENRNNNVVNRCPARRGKLKRFYGLLPEQWLKPWPESGLNCLICAEFLALTVSYVPNSAHIRQSRPDYGLDMSQFMGGVPQEQKMLKGHLPRVTCHQVYFSIRR